MPNILVTGANGQLGSEIKSIVNSSLNLRYNAKFYFTGKEELDITSKDLLRQFIDENSIETIINCAAYTAVDKAEVNKDLADLINHKAVGYLAELSKEKDIKLLHISTDYIFDGKNYKPYMEEDDANPQSIYGQTKLDGEKAILRYNLQNSIIIRTSWVYSSYGTNFVKTILRLADERDKLDVVFDQIGSPTYARDLAKIILEIVPEINNEKTEIYNYSNEGILSWYDFTKEVIRMAKLECTISPIETKDYPTPAIRPHYSVLNKSKIKNDFNLTIPYWKDSLDNCLKDLGRRK